MADHLHFDTSFLDNVTHSQGTKPQPSGSSGGGGKGWNVWVVGALIVAGIIILGALGSTDSTTSTSGTYAPTPSTGSSGENSVTYNGQTFRCSDYNYDKATAMRPDATLSTQIDSEGTILDSRISSLKLEQTRIENMYVDEYDQNSIDTYNTAVDNYTYKKNKLETDINIWNSKNTAFNTKVDAYNNYLDANCKPQ